MVTFQDQSAAEELKIGAGDAIWAAGPCTVGFPAIRNNVRGILTANHCFGWEGAWYRYKGIEAGAQIIGSAPYDQAFANFIPQEAFDGEITSVVDPIVGMEVCQLGAASKQAGINRCGKVSQINSSIAIGLKFYYGLAQAWALSMPGDSGAGITTQTGNAAVGTLVGGQNGVAVSPYTWFQPVSRAISLGLISRLATKNDALPSEPLKKFQGSGLPILYSSSVQVVQIPVSGKTRPSGRATLKLSFEFPYYQNTIENYWVYLCSPSYRCVPVDTPSPPPARLPWSVERTYSTTTEEPYPNGNWTVHLYYGYYGTMGRTDITGAQLTL